MKCPQCLEQGVVFEVQASSWSFTFAEPSSFQDAHGKNHLHDSNRLITKYTCPVGHIWHETEARACWCGWIPG